MKNLKVSAKLLVGFSIPAAFILAVGFVSVFSLRGLNKYYVDANVFGDEPLVHAGHILEAIHSLRAETRAFAIFTGDARRVRETKIEMEARFKDFESAVESYGKSIADSETKALFAEAAGAYEKTFKPGAYGIAEAAEKGRPREELTLQLDNVIKPAVDLIASNVRKCMEIRIETLRVTEAGGNAKAANAVSAMLSIIAVCLAASVFLGLYISGLICKPMNAAVNMIAEMSRGHLGARLSLNRRDEIGVMAKTMDMFADDLQNVVIGAMKKISVGDLSVSIEPKDDRDEISDTLKKTVESLKAVIGIMKKISEGDLSAEIKPKGGNDEISAAFKKTVESLKDVIGTMKKISAGDLSVEIEHKGDKDEISAALKTTVESLRELIINDGGRVLQAAANKDLSQRLTSAYKGEFARMKDNINTVMHNLDTALSQVTEAVKQVANASGEISDGAQNLAEGSNEQASSLEEVSSSLEEMSSMTKQNAENSNKAASLANEARSAANDGDVSMKRMANSINQIKQSSDNTAKIIRTIDELAFQTNLLALNAAVEAARAGEAGKGFAVVAEEVRNLALRSADAARNTASMIEESVKSADGGVEIVEEVAKSLSKIVSRTDKVGGLIAEIAAASSEQAQGIEQVNIAVAQMNQVTQRNAANAEESASAAEELSGQSAELANLVGAFKLSGRADRHPIGRGAEAHTPQKRLPAAHRGPTAGRQPKPIHRTAPDSAKTVRAEEIIPLDDEEMGGKIF